MKKYLLAAALACLALLVPTASASAACNQDSFNGTAPPAASPSGEVNLGLVWVNSAGEVGGSFAPVGSSEAHVSGTGADAAGSSPTLGWAKGGVSVTGTDAQGSTAASTPLGGNLDGNVAETGGVVTGSADGRNPFESGSGEVDSTDTTGVPVVNDVELVTDDGGGPDCVS